MSVQQMVEYPKLPLLTVKDAFHIFKVAGFGPSLISTITGFSRPAVTKWRDVEDFPINKRSHQAVSALAYRVLRGLKHKHFPLKAKRDAAPHAMELLSDSVFDRPLSDCSAADLLPASWLDRYNVTREQDAIA